LMAMQYNLVSVNSLGKQAFFGMLSKISEDHIILIDNMEQLYIQKSYISNVFKGKYEVYERSAHIHKELIMEESSSNISVETNEHLDSSLDEEIEHDQHKEEVIVKQIETTDKNESEKSVEVLINSKLTEVETDSINVTNKHLEIHPMNEIIKESSKLLLDTRDLVDKTEDNERQEEPSQERIIRDIASRMNDESKEQSKSSLDEEIEDDQGNEEVIVKQIQTTNKNELEKHVEMPINAKLTEAETDSVNVTNEHLVTHPINETIKETSLLQLDTQNLVDKTEDNDRHEVSSQESDIASFVNDEPKEQLYPSLEEEIENCQHDKEVIVKQIQTTNKSESEKSVEVPINEKLTVVETDSVNVTNEHPETHPINETIKETSLLQLDTQDLADKTEDNERHEEPGQDRIIQDIAPRINDESKEQLALSTEEEIHLNQHEERVMIKHIQSKNIKEAKKYIEDRIISEEQYTHIIPRVRRKNKRRLKTTCCTIKNNKHAISQKKLDLASEFPVHEEDSYKVARRSKRFKSLIHPTGDNTSNNKLESNENFGVLDENPKPTETYTSPLSLRQINPKEEKAILEKQYYALMKHASRKYVEMQNSPESFISLEIFYLPVGKISINEEATIKGQYYSLMKHAEKMYCQLKDEQLKNEK
jgi:hypothetical protein